MTKNQWLALSSFFCFLLWVSLLMGLPGVTLALAVFQGYSTYKYFSPAVKQREIEDKNAKAIEASKIDGRTQQEWYDIVRSLGKDEFEHLTGKSLNGLDSYPADWVTWDVNSLLGNALYNKLIREWYPEKFCNYCSEEDCEQDCDEYYNFKMRAKGVSRKSATLYISQYDYDYMNAKKNYYYELEKWNRC